MNYVFQLRTSNDLARAHAWHLATISNLPCVHHCAHPHGLSIARLDSRWRWPLTHHSFVPSSYTTAGRSPSRWGSPRALTQQKLPVMLGPSSSLSAIVVLLFFWFCRLDLFVFYKIQSMASECKRNAAQCLVCMRVVESKSADEHQVCGCSN